MTHTAPILKIALPGPFRQTFDYLINDLEPDYPIGARVQVSFGRKTLIGIVCARVGKSSLKREQLKAIQKLLDHKPILTPDIFKLCNWASDYYHHPLGEVFAAALPTLLRQGEAPELRQTRFWKLTASGLLQEAKTLSSARRQQALLLLLQANPAGLSEDTLREHEITRQTIHTLANKQWINSFETTCLPTPASRAEEKPLTLNLEQQQVLSAITESLGTFKPFLLEGITGSGKTEVYLQAIALCLQQGLRALVLIPEISLTPQTVDRFKQRFNNATAVLHSGMNDRERLEAWIMAKNGEADIIIGTRSAIFTPIPNLGLIIIDEEHDASFKQQDGFRYSARDLAIVRAQAAACPVVLGTATPSLTTLFNADRRRYHHLALTQRAGHALPPSYHLIDLRRQKLQHGLSEPLLHEIQQALIRGHQVLLFINRRGYAPLLLCHVCGWTGRCEHCDANLTLHQAPTYLICHHCGHTERVPAHCASCQNPHLVAVGIATERLEQALKEYFPDNDVIRIDRDSTRRKGSLDNLLQKIHQGKSQILIGTQMLAKGHHFPRVSLVGILDTDSGLFSSDFSASERLGQLITQVAGRAGRGSIKGNVYIQTYHPDHPLLQALIHYGYPTFARQILEERLVAQLPPFNCLALFRAESPTLEQGMEILEKIKQAGLPLTDNAVQILGPIPAPMQKRAKNYRYQLLCRAAHRPQLQQWLSKLLPLLQHVKPSKQVKWSLDVDPIDMF